ncbi:MAG: nicotinate-nucleotide--dimethylbenzimidazole phosphoribosyltransferase [Actinobacteria bacterium]|nr:MAG: nicotinate-nucleotide--dimethylbenzimidazole phosphoribosyltransferase [Actinomycetota bacterium]
MTVDERARAAAQAALDAKTKPRGSLGRLEELAAHIAAIRGTPEPGRLEAAVVVAAADHGVAAEGVSAYPGEVTRQMLANFEAGGAAVCVLARTAGARVHVVDVGVGRPTGNIAHGPAMMQTEARRLIDEGSACARALEADGVGIVALGEMGIANSTVAAALAAALLGVDPESVCGRGTGIDDEGLGRKVAVVRSALDASSVDRDDPVAVLAGLGGSELAFLCGVALAAAEHNMVVVLDGFISSVAALVAARLAPAAAEAMIAAHLSPEPGHRLVLDALGLQPLLDLGLRLGEGSGAALCLPLLAAALAVLDEMATFATAGVTDAGR